MRAQAWSMTTAAEVITGNSCQTVDHLCLLEQEFPVMQIHVCALQSLLSMCLVVYFQHLAQQLNGSVWFLVTKLDGLSRRLTVSRQRPAAHGHDVSAVWLGFVPFYTSAPPQLAALLRLTCFELRQPFCAHEVVL